MSDEVKPCEALCPKCGSADISREFRRRGERWDVNDGDCEPASPFINKVSNWCREAARECITHYCRICQFDWQTKPLPKQQPQPQREEGKG